MTPEAKAELRRQLSRVRKTARAAGRKAGHRRGCQSAQDTMKKAMGMLTHTALIDAPGSVTIKQHDHGCVMLSLPDALACHVKYLGRCIPTDDLAKDGRENDPHVTVKYGLHTDDYRDVVDALQDCDCDDVKVEFGECRYLETDDYDVVYIAVESDELHELHDHLSTLPNDDPHKTYIPHVTIAYVLPGKGKLYADKLNHACMCGGFREFHLEFQTAGGWRTKIDLRDLRSEDVRGKKAVGGTFSGFVLGRDKKKYWYINGRRVSRNTYFDFRRGKMPATLVGQTAAPNPVVPVPTDSASRPGFQASAPPRPTVQSRTPNLRNVVNMARRILDRGEKWRLELKNGVPTSWRHAGIEKAWKPSPTQQSPERIENDQGRYEYGDRARQIMARQNAGKLNEAKPVATDRSKSAEEVAKMAPQAAERFSSKNPPAGPDGKPKWYRLGQVVQAMGGGRNDPSQKTTVGGNEVLGRQIVDHMVKTGQAVIENYKGEEIFRMLPKNEQKPQMAKRAQAAKPVAEGKPKPEEKPLPKAPNDPSRNDTDQNVDKVTATEKPSGNKHVEQRTRRTQSALDHYRKTGKLPEFEKKIDSNLARAFALVESSNLGKSPAEIADKAEMVAEAIEKNPGPKDVRDLARQALGLKKDHPLRKHSKAAWSDKEEDGGGHDFAGAFNAPGHGDPSGIWKNVFDSLEKTGDLPFNEKNSMIGQLWSAMKSRGYDDHENSHQILHDLTTSIYDETNKRAQQSGMSGSFASIRSEVAGEIFNDFLAKNAPPTTAPKQEPTPAKPSSPSRSRTKKTATAKPTPHEFGQHYDTPPASVPPEVYDQLQTMSKRLTELHKMPRPKSASDYYKIQKEKNNLKLQMGDLEAEHMLVANNSSAVYPWMYVSPESPSPTNATKKKVAKSRRDLVQTSLRMFANHGGVLHKSYSWADVYSRIGEAAQILVDAGLAESPGMSFILKSWVAAQTKTGNVKAVWSEGGKKPLYGDAARRALNQGDKAKAGSKGSYGSKEKAKADVESVRAKLKGGEPLKVADLEGMNNTLRTMTVEQLKSLQAEIGSRGGRLKPDRIEKLLDHLRGKAKPKGSPAAIALDKKTREYLDKTFGDDVEKLGDVIRQTKDDIVAMKADGQEPTTELTDALAKQEAYYKEKAGRAAPTRGEKVLDRYEKPGKPVPEADLQKLAELHKQYDSIKGEMKAAGRSAMPELDRRSNKIYDEIDRLEAKYDLTRKGDKIATNAEASAAVGQSPLPPSRPAKPATPAKTTPKAPAKTAKPATPKPVAPVKPEPPKSEPQPSPAKPAAKPGKAPMSMADAEKALNAAIARGALPVEIDKLTDQWAEAKAREAAQPAPKAEPKPAPKAEPQPVPKPAAKQPAPKPAAAKKPVQQAVAPKAGPKAEPQKESKPDPAAEMASGKTMPKEWEAKHVPSMLESAHDHLKKFVEFRGGPVEIPRLYHEAKKRYPGLTVDRFKDMLWGMAGERKVELMEINERHLAKERDLGIDKDDGHRGSRLYYYLRFVKPDTTK